MSKLELSFPWAAVMMLSTSKTNDAGAGQKKTGGQGAESGSEVDQEEGSYARIFLWIASKRTRCALRRIRALFKEN